MAKALKEDENQLTLIDLPLASSKEAQFKPIHHPIWTENKARLIERYLFYFLMITRHGTYIDGFAGPQERDKPEMWSAKLVLESEPRWFRHFHLFDDNRNQIKQLKLLKESQPPRNRNKHEPKRDINIYHGDFNILVKELLERKTIREKEATFCLLDQRTFECHWTSLQALASYKTSENKIEIFYFLPNKWMGRAFANQQDMDVIRDWWGRDDWTELRGMNPNKRKEEFMKRFKEELGYRSVLAWPIYKRQEGGAIMYHMIHATDHPDAPKLMRRAYENAVMPKEAFEQLDLLALIGDESSR